MLEIWANCNEENDKPSFDKGDTCLCTAARQVVCYRWEQGGAERLRTQIQQSFQDWLGVATQSPTLTPTDVQWTSSSALGHFAKNRERVSIACKETCAVGSCILTPDLEEPKCRSIYEWIITVSHVLHNELPLSN